MSGRGSDFSEPLLGAPPPVRDHQKLLTVPCIPP